jgi:hypothetical protein
MIISWSSPCTMIIFLAPPLGLYQPHLIHTLSIEVSTKVSSISQNQTRAFNCHGHHHGDGGVLPLFSREDAGEGALPRVQWCTTLFSREGCFWGLWLGWSLPSLGRWHRHALFNFLAVGIQPLGRSPPCLVPGTALSSDLTDSSSKGPMGLFACVAINRECGRLWPLSWHLTHFCSPFESWANTIHSLGHLISSFEWGWWASSALHWVASSCGTRWKLSASCELVTLGVCRHLDGPVIGGSLSGVGDCLRPRSVACVGSWPSPCEEPKGTLLDCLCHWATSLVRRFLQRPCGGLGVWYLLAPEPPSVDRHNED